MLSESTARLVENLAALGEPERVHVKNVDEPVHARRLLGSANTIPPPYRVETGWPQLGTQRRRARCWTRSSAGSAVWSASSGRPASGRAGWFVKPSRPPLRAVSRCSAPTASPTPATSRFTLSDDSCARRRGSTNSKPMPRGSSSEPDSLPPTAKTSCSSMTCSGFVTPRSHCPRLPRMHCGDV